MKMVLDYFWTLMLYALISYSVIKRTFSTSPVIQDQIIHNFSTFLGGLSAEFLEIITTPTFAYFKS